MRCAPFGTPVILAPGLAPLRVASGSRAPEAGDCRMRCAPLGTPMVLAPGLAPLRVAFDKPEPEAWGGALSASGGPRVPSTESAPGLASVSLGAIIRDPNTEAAVAQW
jgi:hypothetical protein